VFCSTRFAVVIHKNKSRPEFSMIEGGPEADEMIMLSLRFFAHNLGAMTKS
jgi:hypothetical protein